MLGFNKVCTTRHVCPPSGPPPPSRRNLGRGGSRSAAATARARVTHAGNGSAGMTGIHYRISEAPAESLGVQIKQAEQRLTRERAPESTHQSDARNASRRREARPCRAYRASDSTNRKGDIQNKDWRGGGGVKTECHKCDLFPFPDEASESEGTFSPEWCFPESCFC